MSDLTIKQVEPDDEEIAEEWVVDSDDDETWGVSAVKMSCEDEEEEDESEESSWSVYISVAEFIREEPLEGQFRALVNKALSGVAGVNSLYEQDREMWGVEGEPSGEALINAVLPVITSLKPDIDKMFEALNA